MKSVRLEQIFSSELGGKPDAEWGSVEDLPTKRGQKRCAKMAVLNLSVLPKLLSNTKAAICTPCKSRLSLVLRRFQPHFLAYHFMFIAVTDHIAASSRLFRLIQRFVRFLQEQVE